MSLTPSDTPLPAGANVESSAAHVGPAGPAEFRLTELPGTGHLRAVPHGSIVRQDATPQVASDKSGIGAIERAPLSKFGSMVVAVLEGGFGQLSVGSGVFVRPRPNGNYEFGLGKLPGNAAIFASLKELSDHRAVITDLLERGHSFVGRTPSLPALRFMRLALQELLPKDERLGKEFKRWEQGIRQGKVDGQDSSSFAYQNEQLTLRIEPYRPSVVEKLGYQLMRHLRNYPPGGDWFRVEIRPNSEHSWSDQSLARRQGLARYAMLVGSATVGALPTLYSIAQSVSKLSSFPLAEASPWVIYGAPVAAAAVLSAYAAASSWLVARGDSARRFFSAR